jgi:hypothetical protein
LKKRIPTVLHMIIKNGGFPYEKQGIARRKNKAAFHEKTEEGMRLRPEKIQIRPAGIREFEGTPDKKAGRRKGSPPKSNVPGSAGEGKRDTSPFQRRQRPFRLPLPPFPTAFPGCRFSGGSRKLGKEIS